MKMNNWCTNTIALVAMALLLGGLLATIIGVFGVVFYATTHVPSTMALAVGGPAAIYSADLVLRRKLRNKPKEGCGCRGLWAAVFPIDAF